MGDRRHHDNPFPDYKGETVSSGFGKIKEELSGKIEETIKKLLKVLEDGLAPLPTDGDYSVYTGWSGPALLYLHLSVALGESRKAEFLNKSMSILTEVISTGLRDKNYTFLCGDAGVFAIGAVVFSKFGHATESKDCLRKLQLMKREMLKDSSSVCDEVLYGRAGYLYSLLFVQHHLGTEAVDNSVVVKICEMLIQSGKALAAAEKWSCPLMYVWHRKHYLGAAHGLVGILTVLMQVSDDSVKSQLHPLIRPTVDWLLSQKYPSNNFPSSVESEGGDKLVQWCHGAPGWANMFCLAYKLYNDQRYLAAAEQCGDVTWARGLLRKGDGLCHGSAGNAYAFLTLYNLTRDDKHLYRASKFTEWCFDYENHRTLKADRPFSLFEGIAGTIYFLADMLNPSSAKFPAFQL